MSIDVGNDGVTFEECSVADLLEVDDDRWERVTAWRDELRRPLDDDLAQRHIWAAAACARHAQALEHHRPRPVRPLARLALASGVIFMGMTGLAAADILPAASVAGHVATVISAPLFELVAPQPEPAPPAAPVAHAPSAPPIPAVVSTETSAPPTDPAASVPPSSIEANPASSTIPTTAVPSTPAPSTSIPIPTTTAPSDGTATGQGSPPEPASSTTTTAPSSSTTTPSTMPASTTTTAPAGGDTATAQDVPGSTTSTPATSTPSSG